MSPRSRAAVTVLIAIVGAGWWLASRRAGEVEPSALGVKTYTDPEDWVRSVAATGEGEIRFVRTEASGDSPAEAAASTDSVKVSSLGPLSAAGTRALESNLSSQIAELERKLSGSPDLGYAQQLNHLVGIALRMAFKERVARGEYVTITPGSEPPPTPKGCNSLLIDAFQLAGGDSAQVFVIVDGGKFKELRDLQGALRAAEGAERARQLQEWNDQPEPVRQAAIERHLQLRVRAADDPKASLTSDEFSDYWRMELLIQALRVDIVPGRTVLFPQ